MEITLSCQYLPIYVIRDVVRITDYSSNSEVLHAQERTHMNGIAFLISSALRFKKKKDRPTDPLDFRAKRANKPVKFGFGRDVPLWNLKVDPYKYQFFKR